VGCLHRRAGRERTAGVDVATLCDKPDSLSAGLDFAGAAGDR